MVSAGIAVQVLPVGAGTRRARTPGAWQQGSESGGGESLYHEGWELYRQVRAALGFVAVPTHLGYLAATP
jgi:hypothetical protein